MTRITVRPTRADRSVANAISTHTGPRTERAAAFLTWGADEHILCALAAGWWLYCRDKDASARRASDHILLTTLVGPSMPPRGPMLRSSGSSMLTMWLIRNGSRIWSLASPTRRSD